MFATTLKAGLAAGCALLATGTALAQAVPQAPSAPTREEIDRPRPDRAQPRARLEVEGGVERAPCALDRPEYQNIAFTLTDVVFNDLRGLAPEALRPAWAAYAGREVPVATICEIRDRAATILREAGYVASVEVPEQRIADGTVRFQVLMARLVGVRVRGDAGRSERTIAGYLERLTGQEAFNRYEAERYLLLAGDLPGHTVRLALRSAGAGRGEVIGEVTVIRTAAAVDVNVQNWGSRELGRWGGLVRAQLFGLTGLGDRTTIALFGTSDLDEQRTVQLGHDFRLGSEGLTIGGQVTHAWANPDLGDPAIDVESRTLFATLEASYPFVRRQLETLRGGIGFDLVDQDIDLNGLDFSRDRLRVAFARINWERIGALPLDPAWTLAEPVWRVGASAELRQGLDVLGATRPCGVGFIDCLAPGVTPPTRFEADPTATVLRGTLSGEYRPVPKVTFALAMRGQYSRRPLLAFEEFAAGNYTVGRGYDPGTILGDSGFGFQAELRFGSSVPRTPSHFTVEPYFFFDQAWVWNQDRLLAAPDEELSSVGGGLRAAWGDRFRLDVVLAAPLDRAGLLTERRDPHLLVSFTTRLWPWSLR